MHERPHDHDGPDDGQPRTLTYYQVMEIAVRELLIEKGVPGQMHGFGDRGFGDFAAAPALDDKIPGKSAFHV